MLFGQACFGQTGETLRYIVEYDGQESHDAVEAHCCVDIVAKFIDEQYTTINQSTAGRFDPRVFVNL